MNILANNPAGGNFGSQNKVPLGNTSGITTGKKTTNILSSGAAKTHTKGLNTSSTGKGKDEIKSRRNQSNH